MLPTAEAVETNARRALSAMGELAKEGPAHAVPFVAEAPVSTQAQTKATVEVAAMPAPLDSSASQARAFVLQGRRSAEGFVSTPRPHRRTVENAETRALQGRFVLRVNASVHPGLHSVGASAPTRLPTLPIAGVATMCAPQEGFALEGNAFVLLERLCAMEPA